MNLRLIARLKAAWAAFCVDPRTVFTVTMPKAASLPVFPPEPPPPPTVIAVQRIHQQLKTDERGVTMEYGVNIALVVLLKLAVIGFQRGGINRDFPAGTTGILAGASGALKRCGIARHAWCWWSS